MNFTESLKKNFQFRYVYNRGRSIANRHLVMYVVKNGAQGNKLGISVSKKVGKSVVRSHVTRLIRESYRNMEEEIRPGYDIVVIARVICKDATYLEVSASLRHLLKKHQLLLSHQEKNCEKEIENEER
ncbi:ribonuclease P protein component [Anaerotignum propionicum]|uniref:ribonuclease P protein component n=1 Tax=Anaerotignum propionicum TaxID=28446 RepID=UPI00210882A1|nr:ribonuclease P protein component [Anaerotignum propionicum]MCQ4935390.1 ribonuclease P protein component [Anaerotignum propionicum]